MHAWAYRLGGYGDWRGISHTDPCLDPTGIFMALLQISAPRREAGSGLNAPIRWRVRDAFDEADLLGDNTLARRSPHAHSTKVRWYHTNSLLASSEELRELRQ
jgi:hypothetical protein